MIEVKNIYCGYDNKEIMYEYKKSNIVDLLLFI